MRQQLIRSRGWFCAAGALLFWASGAQAQVTVTDLGATAPSGPFLVSQPDATATGAPGAGGGLIGNQDYADNGGPPGQTFTAPQNAVLSSIIVHGGNDAGGGGTGGLQFGIQIGSVNPTTGAITQLDLETSARFPNISAMSGDYLSFNLANPVALTSGGLYSWSIDATDGGWYGFTHSTSDVYSGGTAFNNDVNTTDAGNADPKRTFNGFVSPRPYDYTFFASSVPEPMSLGLIAVGALLLPRRRTA
jgi:hypothetical protein